MIQLPRFDELPLHDAILHRTELQWKEKICRIHLEAFTGSGQNATPHVLEFTRVVQLRVPHTEPWGPSFFINVVRGSAIDGFEIEMQSGDVIQIIADGFEFRPS